MNIQPTLDGRAETVHPPRIPRFGPIQTVLLRRLAHGPVPDAELRPNVRRSMIRLLDRGVACRMTRRSTGRTTWYLTDRSDR